MPHQASPVDKDGDERLRIAVELLNLLVRIEGEAGSMDPADGQHPAVNLLGPEMPKLIRAALGRGRRLLAKDA